MAHTTNQFLFFNLKFYMTDIITVHITVQVRAIRKKKNNLRFYNLVIFLLAKSVSKENIRSKNRGKRFRPGISPTNKYNLLYILGIKSVCLLFVSSEF
jgi:hypothetical protein